jgi:succinyl-diaminopimelate desuccinylase
MLSFLRSRRSEMVKLTSELIAIPTENPPGNHYPECRNLLVARLKQLGFAPRVHGESVLAFWGTGKRTLYFSGHYDVVPVQSRSQFVPVVKGGNLFGRGSSDMKSGLVAMIYAMKALEASGAKLDGRIGLVLVPDEETGGRRGSQALLRAGVLGRDGIGMLTAEPTGGVIWNANNGAISLRVTLRGKPAHVSLQHLGVNAFERMLDLAGPLRALKKRVERRKGSLLMMGGRAEGGVNFNTVPGEFSFTIDRRITPEEDFATEKSRLLAALEDAEVEVLQEGASSRTSAKDPLSRALAASIADITGKPAKFEPCAGLLETRFYANQGIPALAYGPGLLTVSHGPSEFVPVGNLEKCAAIYALTAARLLGA